MIGQPTMFNKQRSNIHIYCINYGVTGIITLVAKKLAIKIAMPTLVKRSL